MYVYIVCSWRPESSWARCRVPIPRCNLQAWRFAVRSPLAPAHTPAQCPQHRTLSATAEKGANLLPIIHVFVLADAAQWYIFDKANPPHPLPPLCSALPNLVDFPCAEFRAQQRVCRYTLPLCTCSLHSLSVCTPLASASRPLDSKGEPVEPSRSPAAHAFRTGFSTSDSLVSIVADSLTVLASPLAAVDPAFLFNETQPLLQVALTDNHDFE
ncbi:hypothetical protein N431DRAFT_97644 [Stipitochalara longipes BDJ]|nr:hypothetical protein N431DRAFT_97644 [Stipitochalara longipes BDJ]